MQYVYIEVKKMQEKIEILENDLSNVKSQLELSNRYAASLEEKLSINSSQIKIPFVFMVFVVLIISLFILKITEKKF